MRISTDKVLQNIRCNFGSFIANDQNMMDTCQTQRNPITQESGNVQCIEFAVHKKIQSTETVYAALFFKDVGVGVNGLNTGGDVLEGVSTPCTTGVRMHAQKRKKSSDPSGG